MEPQTITHTLAPIYDDGSRVLILGTMPSPQSRKIGFYYGHPQNRFWRVLAAVFNESVPKTNDERTALILRHHLALWDVLASCTIAGASDASIAEPVPNDLSLVVENAPITTLVTTGGKAAQLLKRFYKVGKGSPDVVIAGKRVVMYEPGDPSPKLDSEQTLTWITLPSTSPANAAMSLDALVEAYQVLRDFV